METKIRNASPTQISSLPPPQMETKIRNACPTQISSLPPQIQISVKIVSQDSQVTLTLNPTDTIDTVVAFLQREGFVVDDQHFLLLFSGENLLEYGFSTIADIDIGDKAELQLCEKGCFPILVRDERTGERVAIEVESVEMVGSLKRKIHGRTGVPPSEQYLYYGDRLMDRDRSRLLIYDILKPPGWIPEHTIHLKPKDGNFQSVAPAEGSSSKYKIFVEIPMTEHIRHRITLEVKPTDTVANLKAKINDQAYIHDRNGELGYIHKELYVLLFGRKSIEDDFSTIDQCGIKDQDRILLCPRVCFNVCFVVANPIGTQDVRDIGMESSDTIMRVREKILPYMKYPKRISPEKILLRYRERWLVDDESRLIDYDIVGPPPGSWFKQPEIQIQVVPYLPQWKPRKRIRSDTSSCPLPSLMETKEAGWNRYS